MSVAVVGLVVELDVGSWDEMEGCRSSVMSVAVAGLGEVGMGLCKCLWLSLGWWKLGWWSWVLARGMKWRDGAL